MPLISFFVPGDPVTQGSKKAMRTRGGRAILRDSSDLKRADGSSGHLSAWRTKVAVLAKNAGARPVDGPVGMRLTFCLSRPSSVPKSRRGYPSAKPDDDKLLRAVSDALSGVAYVDDAQRCETHVYKRYTIGDSPTGVVVEVWPLECRHDRRGKKGQCLDCDKDL